MDIPLHPLMTVSSGTFSIFVAPGPLLLGIVEGMLGRRRRSSRLLYICGNYSLLLSRINRQCPDFHIRRAFTAFQLLSILEEADFAVIVAEHDPTLYDDAPEVLGQVAMACVDRAQGAALVLLSPSFDPALQRMSEWAHRIVLVDGEGTFRGGTGQHGNARTSRLRNQLTLEEVF